MQTNKQCPTCSETFICNPVSGRCVSRTGPTGARLVARAGVFSPSTSRVLSPAPTLTHTGRVPMSVREAVAALPPLPARWLPVTLGAASMRTGWGPHIHELTPALARKYIGVPLAYVSEMALNSIDDFTHMARARSITTITPIRVTDKHMSTAEWPHPEDDGIYYLYDGSFAHMSNAYKLYVFLK